MNGVQFVQVVTTADSVELARELAHLAVEARLAACAQVYGPIESVYQWQGKIEEAKELTVVFKTTIERESSLEQLIRQHHSYTVPEILAVPVLAGHQPYLDWIRDSTE